MILIQFLIIQFLWFLFLSCGQDAFRFIKYGDADVMIAGGAEAAVEPLALAGFNQMKVLTLVPDPLIQSGWVDP